MSLGFIFFSNFLAFSGYLNFKWTNCLSWNLSHQNIMHEKWGHSDFDGFDIVTLLKLFSNPEGPFRIYQLISKANSDQLYPKRLAGWSKMTSRGVWKQFSWNYFSPPFLCQNHWALIERPMLNILPTTGVYDCCAENTNAKGH